MAGRPCKLTPDTVAEIVKYIRAGSFRETAANAAGIHNNTLRSWLKRAATDRAAGNATKYTRFAEAMDRAEAEAEIRDVAKIEAIGRDGDWRALAWVLERRGAKRWGIRAAERAASERDSDGAYGLILDRLETGSANDSDDGAE